MDLIQQRESTPCFQSFLFAPCNLIGRVCEHWREIALIAATALCVIGFILSFLSGSLFMCMIFTLIGSITIIETGEMRDLGTLHDVAEELKGENNTYKLNNLRNFMQIEALTGQVDSLKEENTNYVKQNLAHQQENEIQRKNNEAFIIQVQTYKESFDHIKTSAETAIDLLKSKGVDSVTFQNSADKIVEEITKTTVLYGALEANMKGNFKEVTENVSKELRAFIDSDVKPKMIEEINMRKEELLELKKTLEILRDEIRQRQQEAEKQVALIKSQTEHLEKEKKIVEDQHSKASEELKSMQEANKKARDTLTGLIEQIGKMQEILSKETTIQQKTEQNLEGMSNLIANASSYLQGSGTPASSPIKFNQQPFSLENFV